MLNLTTSLENFLLQIELIDNDKDSSFGYTSIVDQTNEYKAQYFLKYPATTVLKQNDYFASCKSRSSPALAISMSP
jgi:hypothetical protein